MSGPDLLERVRMCLAEVGVTAPGLWFDGEAICYDGGDSFDHLAEMVWRAEQIVTGEVVCRSCESRRWWLDGDEYRAVTDACRAFLPLTEDCGIAR